MLHTAACAVLTAFFAVLALQAAAAKHNAGGVNARTTWTGWYTVTVGHAKAARFPASLC